MRRRIPGHAAWLLLLVIPSALWARADVATDLVLPGVVRAGGAFGSRFVSTL